MGVILVVCAFAMFVDLSFWLMNQPNDFSVIAGLILIASSGFVVFKLLWWILKGSQLAKNL